MLGQTKAGAALATATAGSGEGFQFEWLLLLPLTQYCTNGGLTRNAAPSPGER